jgi:hypothetical protein
MSLRALLAEVNPEATLWDGFDAALVGLAQRPNASGPVGVYDRELITRVLVDRDGMDEDEADDWISFQLERGDGDQEWPVVMTRMHDIAGDEAIRAERTPWRDPVESYVLDLMAGRAVGDA